MDKQVDYRSPEFYKILETVNEVLTDNDLEAISETDGKISASRFNKGKYDNIQMWRVTNTECPQLFTEGFMDILEAKMGAAYPKYTREKVLTFGNPNRNTTSAKGKLIASIVIMITELDDNVITLQDLKDFKAEKPEVVEKCLEIESRMYRREGDTRDPATRIEDFAFSLVYEPKLEAAELKNITGLKLKHQTKAVILETDPNTDFSGRVNNIYYNIEGKSTKANILYEDTDVGHKSFAEYFAKRVETGSLGNLHGAAYVLFVLKNTGDVICIEVNNYENNWLAGKINFN